MLIEAERSCLLVIDVQEKLAPAIAEADSLVANLTWLIQAAVRMEIPVLMSEQYPKGLGPTLPALRGLLPDSSVVQEKSCFSCTAEPAWRSIIMDAKAEQMILMGIEAHVCVLQTALGLRQMGKDVYVVADCIGSRQPLDKELALARMRAAGIHIVSREMVVFEWLYRAGTPLFREISRDFLR